MRRAVLALLAAAAAAGCDDSSTAAPTATLRQPSSIVAFFGHTLDPVSGPGARWYFAVANSGRNDLAVVNALTDVPVLSPIKLESLRVPVERPALLASSRLGDADAADRPDLLVAVSAGDSVLQLVRTWQPAGAELPNEVVDTLDLEADVVAMAALPPGPGTARLAVALAGRRLAVVEYGRVTDSAAGAIEPRGVTVSDLPFQIEALAAMPGDPSTLYAASLEPVDGVSVLGVGAIALTAEGAVGTTRAIDALAPTRLVAALSGVRERAATHPQPGDPTIDVSPFVDQPTVDRIYAVLDESGCGPAHPIDCGIAVLDPAAGLLPDPAGVAAGRLPYLAPIQPGGRTLALAVAPPPAVGPPDAVATAPYAGPAPAYMRLSPASGARATTAVGAAALDTGSVVFLDLGRWTVANDAPAPTAPSVAPSATLRDVPGTGTPALQQRLWLKPQAIPPPEAADPFLGAAEAASGVTLTPGVTRNETFNVTWQGVLPSLSARRAEAGIDGATGQVWLALQTGEGTGPERRVLQRVVLADPSLGVRPGPEGGDVVQIDAAAVPGCLARLEAREGGAGDGRFDARAAGFLEPTAAYPGGALLLAPAGDQGALDGCHADLAARIAAEGGVATNLLAWIRAGELVVTSTTFGYVGRPAPVVRGDGTRAGWTFALAHPGDESTLAGEELVLARKARVHHHVPDDCAGGTCALRGGPVLGFRVDLERSRDLLAGEPDAPLRDSFLRLETASGVSPYRSLPGAGLSSHPTGALAFDRSGFEIPQLRPGEAGYRFLVPYATGVVLDAAPSHPLAGPFVIR